MTVAVDATEAGKALVEVRVVAVRGAVGEEEGREVVSVVALVAQEAVTEAVEAAADVVTLEGALKAATVGAWAVEGVVEAASRAAGATAIAAVVRAVAGVVRVRDGGRHPKLGWIRTPRSRSEWGGLKGTS